MTNEELIKEISALPAEIKDQIGRMIERFKKDRAGKERSVERKPLRDEPFVGIWADREDMKDPVEWVRNIRQTAWHRSHR